MGPEEYASREELGIMVKFLVAKHYQQAEVIGALVDLLMEKKVFSDQEFKSVLMKLKDSPHSQRAAERLAKVQEFATIRNTVREYLDPQEE